MPLTFYPRHNISSPETLPATTQLSTSLPREAANSPKERLTASRRGTTTSQPQIFTFIQPGVIPISVRIGPCRQNASTKLSQPSLSPANGSLFQPMDLKR